MHLSLGTLASVGIPFIRGVYSDFSNQIAQYMPILHSVFFYFKPDVPPDAIEAQRKAILEDLSKIETVNQIWAGAPEGIDRDVVDNTYGMSLHMVFIDLQALQQYQSDPIHLAFIGEYKPNWTGIKIYDTRV
jgi:hypothetical protein